MWYLRAFPARPRAVLGRLDCLWISSRHESSIAYWKPEEDKRLLEIYEQAVNDRRNWAVFAASELGGRTVNAVEKRIRVLRHGTPAYSPARTRWSEFEDSILRKKLQQGLAVVEILKYLPGRSFQAISYRSQELSSLANITQTRRVRSKDFTDDDIQRAIHMRCKEGKTLSEIATEFRCSLSTARTLWQRRCTPLLSEDALESTRRGNNWSHEESLHLRELYTQTELCINDITLHFPSRNRNAVTIKIIRLQLSFERRQRKAALNNENSGLTPAATSIATPVTPRTPRQTPEGFGQRRMFSSSTTSRRILWTPEEDQKLLELAKQGATEAEISKALGCRSIDSVSNRAIVLKVGLCIPGRSRWTTEEDATILDKRRQGLTFVEVAKSLPGRNYEAVRARMHRLRSTGGKELQRRKRTSLNSSDIQRIIEMRLHENMSFVEVATQLGHPYDYIRNTWTKRCVPLLSKEALRSVHAASRNSWSNSELQHLVDLCNQHQGKLDLEKLALQFPSRTTTAVRKKRGKILHLLDMEKKPPKTSEHKHANSSQSRESSSPRGLRPTRPNLSIPNDVEGISRRAFSSSSRASLRTKHYDWTDDQDQKVLELERQGLPVSRIADLVGGFVTRAQVSRRVHVLKAPRPSKRQKWSAEEDAILIQRRQEGLRIEDIVAQLPGRSLQAVHSRWYDQLLQIARDQHEPWQSKGPRRWTDAELQRMIKMRVNERKSFADIATELGRSHKSVRSAWFARCAPQLPEEALRQVWNVRRWSVEEEERFIQLRNQGLPIKDIALQFPSRSGYKYETEGCDPI